MRPYKLFALLAVLAATVFAQTPTKVPITGNVGTILGTPSPYATVEIDLYNCPAPVTVTGYSGLVQTAAMIQADASGNVNSTIWPNDVITCNGTTGQSTYGVTYVVSGVPSGSVQCYSILSSQANWNITTQQPVTCGSSPPNPSDATYRNLVVNGNLSLAQPLTSLTAEITNGVYSVLGFGALCNGTHDDTPGFNAAASAANTAYTTNGTPVTVTYPGNCVVNGNVTVSSGVHWYGNGGTILVASQNGTPTFNVLDADDVSFDAMKIIVTTSGSDVPTNAAIAWSSSSSDSAPHSRFAVRNSTVIGSAWGIVVMAIQGTTTLDDVKITGNTVKSASPTSNWDGIHVAGAVTNTLIDGNTVENRGDAGIGLTSELNSGVYRQLSGAVVTHNVLFNNIVNLDNSGATNTEWANNFVASTFTCTGAQGTSYRQIYYLSNTSNPTIGGYPLNAHVHDNYLQACSGSAATAGVKIDPEASSQTSWPNLTSTFEHNIINGTTAPLYARGNGFTIGQNTFAQGGTVTLDYDGTDSVATANVVIAPNKWMASGSLVAGGGCSLYSNIILDPQDVVGSITYTNLSCLGSQNFSLPGGITVGSNAIQAGGSTGYITISPGASAAFSLAVKTIAGSNALVIDPTGNTQFNSGTLTANGFVQGAGFATGASAPTLVIPNYATGHQGATGTLVDMAAGTFTTGNLRETDTNGNDADSGLGASTVPTKSGTPTAGAGVCWKTSTQLGTCTAGTWPNCSTCN